MGLGTPFIDKEKKMKPRRIVPIVLLAGLMFSVTACSKTIMQEPAPVAQEPVAQVAPAPPAPEPAPEPTPVPQAFDQSKNDRALFLYDHVYFDFDSAVLRPDTRQLLALKVQWLQNNPDVMSVFIEGYCDERGTEAYNLALGARRAQVVKNYLVQMGITSQKLISKGLGEENPLDTRHTEEAWAKNRRVSFVIN